MDWKDLLEELIDVVQQTAPELWRIANRQVYGDIARNCLWIIVCIIVIYVGIRLLKHGYKLKEDDYSCDWEYAVMCGWIMLGVSPIVLVSLLDSVIGKLINPEYYAIQVLMNLIK